MKKIIFLLIAISIGFSACNFTDNKNAVVIKSENIIQIELNDSIRNSLIRIGNSISRQTQSILKKELGKTIKSGGFEHAIGFCNLRATNITDSISMVEQIMIKRVAIKNRNADFTMTKEEIKFFEGATKMWEAEGVVKPALSVNNDNQPVYYQSIIMNKACLNCHGSLESDIKPKVAERIKELYPDDKAVNFKVTDLRGMWVITFPEYSVK